jgi:CTP synthase (UTP-ammonia lyase)
VETYRRNVHVGSRAPYAAAGTRRAEIVTLVKTAQNPRVTVNIAVVDKYVNLVDRYKSLHEAIAHGAIANETPVQID